MLFLLTIALGHLFINKNILIWPGLILYTIDTLYSPLKRILRSLNVDDTIIDQISIEVRNRKNSKKWDEIPPSKKLIFLPHCLRSANCPAKLQKHGMNCVECGLCCIGQIKKESEPYGYKIYIVPGSSFVEKIVREEKFKAVLGVACYEDLNLMMIKLADFYPQGILLKQRGCFETKVDINEVLRKIIPKEST